MLRLFMRKKSTIIQERKTQSKLQTGLLFYVFVVAEGIADTDRKLRVEFFKTAVTDQKMSGKAQLFSN